MTDAEAKHIKKFIERLVKGSPVDHPHVADDSLYDLAERIRVQNPVVAVELRVIQLEAISLYRQLFGAWK